MELGMQDLGKDVIYDFILGGDHVFMQMERQEKGWRLHSPILLNSIQVVGRHTEARQAWNIMVGKPTVPYKARENYLLCVIICIAMEASDQEPLCPEQVLRGKTVWYRYQILTLSPQEVTTSVMQQFVL